MTGSLPKVQPNEAGHFFAHELGAPLVGLVVLLGRLLPRLLIAAGRPAQCRLCGLEVLLPLDKFLLELPLADPFRRGNEGDAVPDEEVELAVTVHVSDPDPGRMGGALEVLLAEDLAVLDLGPRLDQRPERQEVRHLAL